MLKTDLKEEETVKLARQAALISRKERFKNHPEDFRHIPGTCVFTPRTKYLRKLAGFEIVPIGPVDMPGFEFFPCLIGGKLYVEPSQVAGIEAERILLLKAYYHLNYCLNPYNYESRELYIHLPEFIQQSLLFYYKGQRTFAAYQIFGTEDEFRCVAQKFNANPFLIADAYVVPPCYVMYQMAELGVAGAHFWTAMDKKPTRVVGNGHLWLKNINRSDLLISILGDLLPQRHNQFIYRCTKIDNDHLICIGGSLEKRGRTRTHVFGLNRKFVDAATLADFKSASTKFDSDMLK